MNDRKPVPHYTQGEIECIDAIRAALGPEGFRIYCIGNVLKYTWRYPHKGGADDLSKATDYLRWANEIPVTSPTTPDLQAEILERITRALDWAEGHASAIEFLVVGTAGGDRAEWVCHHDGDYPGAGPSILDAIESAMTSEDRDPSA